MNTTINGQNIQDTIAAEVLRKLKEMNPQLHPEEYKSLEDVPGFKEIMERPRYVSFDRSDHKLYIEARQKLERTKRFRKNFTVDLRRDADGHQSVAAIFKGQVLWELPIAWDITIEI